MSCAICSGIDLRTDGLRFDYELPARWAKYLGKDPSSTAAVPLDDRSPWPANFKSDVGCAGLALLHRFLDYDRGTRITAEAASSHAFFHPDRFPLMGYPASAPGECVEQGPVVLRPGQPGDVVEFTGERHDWVVRSGEMAPEILAWMRDDPGFKIGTAENDIIQECFHLEEHRKDVSEIHKDTDGEDVKLCITAGLRSNVGEFMHTKELHSPNPVNRMSAYVEAFKNTNRPEFLVVEATTTQPVRRLAYKRKGLKNAHDFLQKSLDRWLLPCHQLNFTKGVKRNSKNLEEPSHFDGGPSALHLGLGLGGRRDVVCDQVGEAPNVALKNKPGTVYLGMFTGPRHQVFHRPCPAEELIHATDFGPTSCTLMCRTSLFPHGRSRLMKGYVHTPELYKVFQGCFRTGLRDNDFRLPTLAECIAAEARLSLTLPRGKSHSKAILKKRRAAKSKATSVAKVGNAVKTFTKKKAAAARAAAAADADQQAVVPAVGATDGKPPPQPCRLRSKQAPTKYFGEIAD